MAEWPRSIYGLHVGQGAEDIEVVPADLARELYGALKRVNGYYPEGPSFGVDDILARYEREVAEPEWRWLTQGMFAPGSSK